MGVVGSVHAATSLPTAGSHPPPCKPIRWPSKIVDVCATDDGRHACKVAFFPPEKGPESAPEWVGCHLTRPFVEYFDRVCESVNPSGSTFKLFERDLQQAVQQAAEAIAKMDSEWYEKTGAAMCEPPRRERWAGYLKRHVLFFEHWLAAVPSIPDLLPALPLSVSLVVPDLGASSSSSGGIIGGDGEASNTTSGGGGSESSKNSDGGIGDRDDNMGSSDESRGNGFVDYWEVLGCPANAQLAIIKRKYQALVRVVHPDKSRLEI